MNKITQKIILSFAIVALGLAGYFYYQLYKIKQDPNAQAVAEAKTLVAKVSRLAVLPEGTPEVVTVLDPEALKDQSFFDGSVKGDKVLIYAQAKKAFLYSVSLKKIINITTLNPDAIGQKVQNQTIQTEPTIQTEAKKN